MSASQASSLATTGIVVDSHVYSGSADSEGGGPAVSLFDVTFTVANSTWFQLSGQRIFETALGPNFVASVNEVLLETSDGDEIALDWGDFLAEEIWNGERSTRNLDTLIQLEPGDYRLAVMSLCTWMAFL